MAQVLSLMATHSNGRSTVQAIRMKENGVYEGSSYKIHVYTQYHRLKGVYMYACNFVQRKARTCRKVYV